MIRADALIVGGGPSGSTCARVLRRAGWNVVVVDRARFPRDKVCAGWLTPDVFSILELSPADYRAAGLTLQPISAFRTGVIGGPMIETRYDDVVSYGILRREFDHFLLQRSGARVLEDTAVESIRRSGATWIVNDDIQAPILVGAGGHFCPVARHLRGGAADVERPIVAKEAEFRRARHSDDAPQEPPSLFFCGDFDGYGWCVPKGDYLNVGIGRRNSRDFSTHLRQFVELLEDHDVHAGGNDVRWHGHAYFASGAGTRPLIGSGVVLLGDAAGLAYPESGEGIRPAIESGRRAGETLVAAGGRAEIDDLQPYADAIRACHPAMARPSAAARAIATRAGRLLLRSSAFNRHVVLDRWFLRSGATFGAEAHPR